MVCCNSSKLSNYRSRDSAWELSRSMVQDGATQHCFVYLAQNNMVSGHVASRSAGLLSQLKSLIFDLLFAFCNPCVYMKAPNIHARICTQNSLVVEKWLFCITNTAKVGDFLFRPFFFPVSQFLFADVS